MNIKNLIPTRNGWRETIAVCVNMSQCTVCWILLYGNRCQACQKWGWMIERAAIFFTLWVIFSCLP